MRACACTATVADDRPARGRAAGLHPQRGVHVGIHPAADVQDGRLDGVVVRGQRARSPVRAVVLLAEPLDEPRRRRLEAGEPPLAPVGTPERRVRRHRVHRHLADRVLAQLADRDAAADVVDVGPVAVVRALDRDDRAQVRRPELGDLDRGERPVADAPHPDGAGAPRLGRQPLDGVVAVERLGLGVLVERDAARRPGPADVDPAQGIATFGEVRATRDVRVPAPVVLAVRDHLEDRRHAVTGGHDGQPQVRRQLHAVARRDPRVPDGLDLVSWLVRDGHRPSLGLARDTGRARPAHATMPGWTTTPRTPRPRTARGPATPGASPTRTRGSPSGTTM